MSEQQEQFERIHQATLALQEEHAEKWMKELARAQNVADGTSPIKLKARPHSQMGVDCLIATCPRCGTVAGLTAAGRHLCRQCHLWMEYVAEGG